MHVYKCVDTCTYVYVDECVRVYSYNKSLFLIALILQHIIKKKEEK